jgi:hypothetical protein
MFVVSVEETIRLAEAEHLQTIVKLASQDGILGRPGVSWARLAFSREAGRL